MGFRSAISPLISDQSRRETLVAVTAGYMLIQLSSLPVALTLPTLAEQFNTGLDKVAWIVIVYLATLGSFVLVGARFGDRYGHARVFFLGLLASTIGAVLISVSNSLWQIVAWRAVTGFGAALVMGNANAIIAATYPVHERGRAFAVPIMGARFGTLVGLAAFGLFLQFLSWRLVFVSFLPMGIVALLFSLPMLRQRTLSTPVHRGPIDLLGGALLAATVAVLILSGSHLHGGEESFTSPDGRSYHLPMHVLFVVLLGVFILVERSVKNPMVELRHFGDKYFSMSLVSNTTFHLSMLATMTLVPILVERGFGKGPLWVTVVLLPNQVLGLVMPFAAGWIYDRYQPKLLRPGSLVLIAAGFLGLGLFAGQVPFWALPFMMVPISIGTSVFNPVNNATVMSSLPLEHRGFASGMLETTREIGHALGATISAAALAFVLPAGIGALSPSAAQPYYIEGFQFSSMLVVLTLLTGAAIALFHKSLHEDRPAPASAAPAALPSDGDG